jgi:D-xylonolactonase
MEHPGIRTDHHAVCSWEAKAALGEGPLWDTARQVLWWLDIGRALLLKYDPRDGAKTCLQLPFPMTCIAPCSDGRFICTCVVGVCLFDPDRLTLSLLHNPEWALPRNRPNDGTCDARGDFWFGTMDSEECTPTGQFYRFRNTGTCDALRVNWPITNGPAFDTVRGRAYFVDTLGRRLWAADWTGDDLGPLREFASIAVDQGYPDGLAVDEDGGVWCSHWGGGRITRFAFDGKSDTVLHMPVSNITKCAFGGPTLSTLYVATARRGLGPDALAEQPTAGGLFAVEVGWRGQQPHSFSLNFVPKAARQWSSFYIQPP